MFTWGENGLVEWTLPDLRARRLAEGVFAAGCAWGEGFVLQENGRLIRFDASRRELIDTGADAVDLAEIQLFGRRGLLVIHRGMQLRFYEPPGFDERPARGDRRWPYREIYSFYTASEQGGLLVRDIDGDGRPDLICGNYWVQAPAWFELPWRLFAINLYHEEPLSASARLAWIGKRLLWVESKRPDARVTWFTPPADPTVLWTAEAIRFDPPLQFPRAILARGEGFLIGEDHGDSSRLVEWPARRVLRTGTPLNTLFAWRGRLVGAGSNGPVVI